MDFLFGAHVDAAGRFVQDQDIRAVGQPFGDDHFLLVPAGEVLHPLLVGRRFDFQRLDELIGHLILQPGAEEAGAVCNLPQGGQRRILPDVHA